jgi:hypothetical protein
LIVARPRLRMVRDVMSDALRWGVFAKRQVI